MASVWKRLQRVNKRAAKFQYTASYHRIDLETTPKWKPTKLCIVWTRRSRRVVTEPAEWEPSLKDPLKGAVIYPVPVNQTVTVTLFKDSRTNELEDKDWTFVIEDVSSTGKRRRLASAAINMRRHASVEAALRPLVVTLAPLTPRVSAATLHLTLHSRLTREGQATDEDMQSLASMLSVNNNSDIAVLEDLDDDDYTLSDHSAKQMSEFRQQLESLTHSLTQSDVAATPNSVQSLAFDSRTPTHNERDDIDINQDDAKTPTGETDLRIFETEDLKRPEYLSNLTEKLTGNGFKTVEKPEPKFVSSTPTKPDQSPERETPQTTPPPATTEPLRTVNLKPKPFEKFNLKPLDLKSNFNSINFNLSEVESPRDDLENGFSDRCLERDKTPVVDLLEWCQSVTSEYHSVKVTNLTTSWRSGLAFCAIIHHFRPDLIDFSGLQPEDAEANLRAAFAASSALGVSPVLTVADVLRPPAPDRLAVMTYLFQLRAHFTGSELQVEQLGTSENECSYLVGRHDTDEELAQQLFTREVSMRRSRNHGKPIKQYSTESRKSIDKSPTAMKDVKDILLQHSKSLLGKVLSPSRDILKPTDKSGTKWFTDPLNATKLNEEPPRPAILMTRKELTDPFGSDDDDSPTNQINHVQEDIPKTPSPPIDQKPQPDIKPTTPVSELPKPTPQLVSRHDELKERARQLLEATKREAREKDSNRLELKDVQEISTNNKPMTEEDRQTMLRDRARKLIADARAGIVSPVSPNRVRSPTVEIISRKTVMDEIAAAGGADNIDCLLSRGSTPPSRNSLSPDRSEGPNSVSSKSVKSTNSAESHDSPLMSFNNLVDRITPDDDLNHQGTESGSYIQSELEALEREQVAVDVRAAALETKLRDVMDHNDNTEEEDRLMSQWFNLVNKKNALLRRQMQLNILEQEEDLSRRCDLLARELRLSLSVEEWRKTSGQKRRERLLLQDLVEAVNQRDRLVQEMDEQEKAIANDDEIEKNLSQVEIQRKNNCLIQ